MSGPTFDVTMRDGRIQVACELCGDGFEGSTSAFGQVMANGFMKQHKCYKSKGRKL